MKEIIHIRAGRLSNFIGTHYFNTLESYFTSPSPNSSSEDVLHEISFREGIAPDGSETFCPRLLLFDFKPNFGALSTISALYQPSEDNDDDLAPQTWGGTTEQVRQPLTQKHQYQSALDDEIDEASTPAPHDVTNWSDFNRVFHAPRSLHALVAPPGPTDGLPVVQQWEEGVERFKREDIDNEIMESDFRHFVEECDNLQGVESSFDCDTFGSFSVAMMDYIRDEMPKQAILLKNSSNDLRQFCDALQGQDDLRFAELNGAFPLTSYSSAAELQRSVYDFTSPRVPSTDEIFSQWSVVRGLEPPELLSLLEGVEVLSNPLATTTTTKIAYPIPSSYPQFFDPRFVTSSGRFRDPHPELTAPSAPSPRTKSVPLFTAARTTPSTAQPLAARVEFIDRFLAAGADTSILGPGIGRDELVELKEDLIHIIARYSRNADVNGGDEEVFEEYDI
ncbi:hypothetical protein DL93DRAFT_2154764 [Clavulina sp. PMI_390]|nr:hypothetical protein DL93DRAFT_2154764 [Clavulina sp. PMI_390]